MAELSYCDTNIVSRDGYVEWTAVWILYIETPLFAIILFIRFYLFLRFTNVSFTYSYFLGVASGYRGSGEVE